MRNFFGVELIMAASLFFGGCASEPPFSEADWLASVKATDITQFYAPHYNEKEKKFFNPWMPQPGNNPFKMMFRRKEKFPPWPEELYTQVENDFSYINNRSVSNISFAGHASFIIKLNGETIFTDPFFSDRAGISGKEVKIQFNYENIPEKAVVLLSHNHYDHLDKQTIKKMADKNPVFLVPLKLKEYIESLGAKEVHELDWWESITLGGIIYTFVPAQHWSLRASPGNGSGKTLWGGWVIEGEKTVYFSGDTGYFRGFEEIGRKWDIDYALLGSGAYAPRWFMHYMHMNPAEFIMASNDLRAKISVPMHFGIISLSDEPINYPPYVIEEFIKSNPAYTERIIILKTGEYLEIGAGL